MISEPPVSAYLNRIKPGGWRQVDSPIPYQLAFLHKSKYLKVMVGYEDYPDGKRWLHFSMSSKGRCPTWEELVEAKEAFLGTETKAIQVIPPRSEYVNIHPHVLHLWVEVNGRDGLPDFTDGTGSL